MTTRQFNSEWAFSLAYYAGDRKTGAVHVVSFNKGAVDNYAMPVSPDTEREKNLKPVFIGVTAQKQAVIMDPKSKQISVQSDFPCDAFAAHDYPEPNSHRVWFMNDGDKETGNDTLNCGDQGSSVTVIENAGHDTAHWIGTVCVGRGHHQALFVKPSADDADALKRVYISNLVDGSISIIDNDPADNTTCLSNIGTINLFNAQSDDAGQSQPNKAFPHGLCYSHISKKLYCLCNGYGDIAVIDPASLQLERRIAFTGHSNLFATPDGRFLIGRGADRKSDDEHVMAFISVYDVENDVVCDRMNLPDIYISKYFFSPQGETLYLTTAVSGNDVQQQHLRSDALLVFDMKAMPTLHLLAELRLGAPAGTLDFAVNDNGIEAVFVATAETGSIAVIDGEHHLVDSIRVCEPQKHSRLWVLR